MKQYFETEEEAIDYLHRVQGVDYLFFRAAAVLLIAVGRTQRQPWETHVLYLVREQPGLCWDKADHVE